MKDGLVTAGFLTSPEYAIKVGNPSAAESVRRLYQDIFKREISPAEISFQVAGLGPADGGAARIWCFDCSAEYRAVQENNLTAPRNYVFSYLKFPPFAHAAGLLQSGTSIPGLRDIEFAIEVSIPQTIADIMTCPAFVAAIQ